MLIRVLTSDELCYVFLTVADLTPAHRVPLLLKLDSYEILADLAQPYQSATTQRGMFAGTAYLIYPSKKVIPGRRDSHVAPYNSINFISKPLICPNKGSQPVFSSCKIAVP